VGNHGIGINPHVRQAAWDVRVLGSIRKELSLAFMNPSSTRQRRALVHDVTPCRDPPVRARTRHPQIARDEENLHRSGR